MYALKKSFLFFVTCFDEQKKKYKQTFVFYSIGIVYNLLHALNNNSLVTQIMFYVYINLVNCTI